jgi:hypothetical protein
MTSSDCSKIWSVALWLTQHDVRSSVTIPTEKKPHSDVPERATMK